MRSRRNGPRASRPRRARGRQRCPEGPPTTRAASDARHASQHLHTPRTWAPRASVPQRWSPRRARHALARGDRTNNAEELVQGPRRRGRRPQGLFQGLFHGGVGRYGQEELLPGGAQGLLQGAVGADESEGTAAGARPASGVVSISARRSPFGLILAALKCSGVALVPTLKKRARTYVGTLAPEQREPRAAPKKLLQRRRRRRRRRRGAGVANSTLRAPDDPPATRGQRPRVPRGRATVFERGLRDAWRRAWSGRGSERPVENFGEIRG